ncbi:MAG: DUF72 domain-containing protein [Candidatus Hydrogenedentes bacterium]|nr:DUF72 domain-containing protein [Candidatus Hydrogenedentota bacterium]
MGKKGRVEIGTSGYQYDHWRGVFYPEDIPKRKWFEYYATRFDTVEINNTFYRLPSAETFEQWHDRAPENFCFTLKYSRYGSHIKHLKDGAETISAYMHAAQRLESKLGPILVQLPPHWKVDPQRLDEFFSAARNHARWKREGLRWDSHAQRWAVEFRDPSWLEDRVYDVLERRGVALCIHDIIKDHPRVVTADWVYLRLHGASDWGNYSPGDLDKMAGEIGAWRARGLDVYAYFNNDAHGYAVANAKDLERRVHAAA